MSTLFDYIAPYGLSASACREEYGSFLSLGRRLIGVPLTDFASIAHLSPFTAALYTSVFRPCFRIPDCDFKKTSLNPRQRRLVLLESSVAHGCAFCTAHVAQMGDAVNGPLVAQCARAGRVVGAGKEDGDDEIAALVHEVCGFPGRVTESTRKNFELKFGPEGYREVASMTAFMAWLNYIMDILGIPIESLVVPFTQLVLAPRALPFDFTKNVRNDGNEVAAQERVRSVTSSEGSKPLRRLRARIENIAEFVALAPHVASALSTEREFLKDIPKSVVKIEAWRRSEFGCTLNFDRQMEDLEVKRSLTFAVREVFLRDEISKWTRFEKFGLMYVFGKGQVDNRVIVDDAVSLAAAERMKESTNDQEGSWEVFVIEAREELEKVFVAVGSSETPSDAFSAAAKFMHSAAGPSGSVHKAGTVEGLITYVESPEAVMDLMGLVGMFGLMQRMSVMCGN